MFFSWRYNFFQDHVFWGIYVEFEGGFGIQLKVSSLIILTENYAPWNEQLVPENRPMAPISEDLH